jgi:predicted amidophosphoribosyltransferase
VVGTPRRLCLVPAPSRPSASRVRGGPHVERLATAAASVLAARGFEVAVAPALELSGSARDAVGLGRAERVANLSGRLRFRHAGRPPPGFPVVILDDVVTTGATAAACAHALAAEGIPVAAVLTLLAAG